MLCISWVRVVFSLTEHVSSATPLAMSDAHVELLNTSLASQVHVVYILSSFSNSTWSLFAVLGMGNLRVGCLPARFTFRCSESPRDNMYRHYHEHNLIWRHHLADVQNNNLRDDLCCAWDFYFTCTSGYFGRRDGGGGVAATYRSRKNWKRENFAAMENHRREGAIALPVSSVFSWCCL